MQIQKIFPCELFRLGFPFHSKFDMLVFCGLKSGLRLDMKISEKKLFFKLVKD